MQCTNDRTEARPEGVPRARGLAIAGLLLAALASLPGCGGSGSTAAAPVPTPSPSPTPSPPAVDTLETVTLPGFPHTVDLYEAAGGRRAIVFLHGGSGGSYQVAHGLGLNSNLGPATQASVDWDWLHANGVMAVFPQGQHIDSAPNGTTWSNHAMDSGVDDVAFLQALSAYLRTRFGFTSVALAGHSMGGTMVNRMWCESPATFDAYVSLAGPASHYYTLAGSPCAPPSKAPYMGIIGSTDTIMQTTGKWEAATWLINPLVSLSPGFLDPLVIGEWVQHGARASQRCGEMPVPGDGVVSGTVQTWSNCGGAIVQRLVDGADHGIDSLEAVSGTPMRDFVASFTAGR